MSLTEFLAWFTDSHGFPVERASARQTVISVREFVALNGGNDDDAFDLTEELFAYRNPAPTVPPVGKLS